MPSEKRRRGRWWALGLVIPFHGKPGSLECSLRLLSSPANSNNTKTYPFSPPPQSSYPVDITLSTFIIYYCLSALVWVLKEQSFLPLAFKKKRKSKYQQLSFQCKCILNLEQQHAFGISSYFVVFVLALGGAFLFPKKKDKLCYLS